MARTIYIDFCEEVFPRVKDTSEVRSRLHDELTEQTVVTDAELDLFKTYFKEFAAELTNETAKFGDLRESDGELTYKFTEKENENGMSDLKQLLVRIIKENMLYRWYDDLGFGELAGTYEALLKQWKNNNAQEPIVTPKYHPYF